MAKRMDNEQYIAAVKGCKKSRSVGLCERECAHWHHASRSYPPFCKGASIKVSKSNVRN